MLEPTVEPLQDSPGGQLLSTMFKFKKARMLIPAVRGVPQGELFLLHQLGLYQQRNTSQGKQPGMRISDLSQQMRMSMPAVSQMLNVLEDKGFVIRSSTKNDRRVVYVALTDQGVTILQKGMQNLKELMQEVTEHFGQEKMDQLIELFDQLYLVIKDVTEKRERAETPEP